MGNMRKSAATRFPIIKSAHMNIWKTNNPKNCLWRGKERTKGTAKITFKEPKNWKSYVKATGSLIICDKAAVYLFPDNFHEAFVEIGNWK